MLRKSLNAREANMTWAFATMTAMKDAISWYRYYSRLDLVLQNIPRNKITTANPILAGTIWTMLTVSERDFSLAHSSGGLSSSVLGYGPAKATCCRAWTDPIVGFSDKMDLRDTRSTPPLCWTLLSSGKVEPVISACSFRLLHFNFRFLTNSLAHRSHTTVLIPPATIKTGKYHRAL